MSRISDVTNKIHFGKNTWLEPEDVCYPGKAQIRVGKAIYPDGVIRTVYAGIADTFFSIPAHGHMHKLYCKGHLSISTDGNDALYFYIHEES